MFLPWVESEIEKIRCLKIDNIKKLNMLFKNVPGICRFKAEDLTAEQQNHFIKSFKLKPSIKSLSSPIRKLNRKLKGGN